MFEIEQTTAFAMLTHERLGQSSPFKGLLNARIWMIIRPKLNIQKAMIRGLLIHPIILAFSVCACVHVHIYKYICRNTHTHIHINIGVMEKEGVLEEESVLKEHIVEEKENAS
jgi:hypothetical protein